MGGIREILLCNDVQTPSFTVPPGNTPAQITLGNYSVFYPANNVTNSTFQAGDSAIIRGYGLYLPENFAFAALETTQPNPGSLSVPYIEMATNYASSRSIVIPHHFSLLRQNVYHVSEFFLDYTYLHYLGNAPYQIVAYIFPQIYISMLNVPDVLIGNKYYARAWIDVEHNLPLITP
jgi:hypothetical protein